MRTDTTSAKRAAINAPKGLALTETASAIGLLDTAGAQRGNLAAWRWPASVRVRDTASRQPLEAAKFPDALLKIQTVVAITGLSATTIYRKLTSGFPAPVRLGARCTRWRSADVTAWLRAQGAVE